MDFDFKKFFLGLDEKQREIYASQAKTSIGYIQTHLISRRKIPRPCLMNRLINASGGDFSREQLLDFFYPKTDTTSHAE